MLTVFLTRFAFLLFSSFLRGYTCNCRRSSLLQHKRPSNYEGCWLAELFLNHTKTMIKKMCPGEGFKLGDTIWLKPDGHLWWPAQVYDENTVSERCKPGKGSVGEVFVRFYGSYTFSYVNPTKYTSEFENMLKKNDGDCRKILQDSMNKGIDISKCGSQKTHEAFAHSLENEKLNENGTGRQKKVGALNSTNDPLARHAADGLTRARASKTSSVAKNGKKASASPQTKSGTNFWVTQNRPSSKKKQTSKVPRRRGAHKSAKKEEPGCDEELKCKSSAKGSRPLGKRKPGRQIAELEEGSKSRVRKVKLNTAKRRQKPGSLVPNGQAKSRTLNKEKLQTKAIAMKKIKKETNSLIEPQMMNPKVAQESSARKMRVMQVLGLVAPVGSPFP